MESKKEHFIELLKEAGGVASVACDKADINYSTFRRWYKSDAEFAEQLAITNILVENNESHTRARISPGIKRNP